MFISYHILLQTVLDHENWYFDLEDANENMVPNFQILYTAKQEYGLVIFILL